MTNLERRSVWEEGLKAAWQRADPRAPLLSPSVMCADWMRMGEEIRSMDSGGADMLHFDVADGHFAPNFIVGLDLIRAARAATDLPFEAHLMVRDPGPVLERFAAAGVQLVCIHPEACADPLEVIAHIRRLGMRAGAALSPHMPTDSLRPMLGLIDEVLVMTIVPGIGGQALIPEMIPRLGMVRRELGPLADSVLIGVDGQVSRATAPEMVREGARLLVCGTSSVFGRGQDTGQALRLFRSDLHRSLKGRAPAWAPAE